jgi:uncharacterized membrane protein YdbT with pleckstrin-like domain
VLGLATNVRALIYYIATELGVTNRRVIGKVGLIARETFEIDHPRVESVNVYQSIMGRFLDYGTVTVRGTGGTPVPIALISHPIAFRNARIKAGESVSR